jgi:hypothetical protein
MTSIWKCCTYLLENNAPPPLHIQVYRASVIGKVLLKPICLDPQSSMQVLGGWCKRWSRWLADRNASVHSDVTAAYVFTFLPVLDWVCWRPVPSYASSCLIPSSSNTFHDISSINLLGMSAIHHHLFTRSSESCRCRQMRRIRWNCFFWVFNSSISGFK